MHPAKSVLESGTTLHTGAIIGVGVVADATFTTWTGLGGDSVSGVTFPAGMTITGHFTAVQPASGTVIIYYGGTKVA